MPLSRDITKAQFRLSGRDLEPDGPEWELATPAQKQGYWRQVAVLARDRKYVELNQGLGVDGQRLARRRVIRRDRASGPVLLPHWSASRCRTELRWQGTANGAVLWWKAPWGKIVGYWAQGVRGIVRDIVGLTTANVLKVAAQARQWWDGQVATGRLGVGVTMQGPAPATIPGIGPLVWHRTPPPRPKTGPFAAWVPPATKPKVVAPTIPARPDPWQVTDRLWPLWDAAGKGRTTRAEITTAVQRLNRVPMATLQEVLTRFGVPPAYLPATKADALDLIRRNLLSRLKGGPKGPLTGGTQPKPKTPTPKPKPVPKPIVPPPPPADRLAELHEIQRVQPFQQWKPATEIKDAIRFLKSYHGVEQVWDEAVPPDRGGISKDGDEAFLSKGQKLRFLNTVIGELNRLRIAYPRMATDALKILYVIDGNRGRANIGLGGHLIAKGHEWEAEQWERIRAWEQRHGQRYTSERPGHQVADNFRHELGHLLSDGTLRDAFKAAMEKLGVTVDNWSQAVRPLITDYAGEGETPFIEAIAETFGIYTRADYNAGDLPKILEEFLAEFLGG